MQGVVIAASLLGVLSAAVCQAGEANILAVESERLEDGSLRVSATVQHDDEGWDHYADRWEILDMSGKVLDTRVLLHPHSPEPFTRTIERTSLPVGTEKVKVRAHDSVHGYGGSETIIAIP